MQNSNWRKAAKVAGVVVLIFCVITTATVGGFVLTNLDHVGRFLRVWQLIQSDYLVNTGNSTLIDGATRGLVDSLQDPYSTYLDASENQALMEQVTGQFGGVGIVLSLQDPKKLMVLRTIKNSPAAKAGIMAEDVITKIDNVDTSTIDLDKAAALIKGAPGSKVTLVVYRESQKKNLTFTLTREEITAPTVDGEALPGYPQLAYIDISQFSDGTADELAATLKNMDIKKYKGIILDLRNNPGGELNAAVGVAGYFIPPGPVVYIVDKHGTTDTKMAANNYLGLPLVVLVNQYSASAAEIVSGAIKDKGTGTLVGVKTFGKGVVQTIFPLDSGTSVKLTTAKYLTPNKIDINKKGIEPDVQVELPKGQDMTITPTNGQFDAQLQEAVKVLQAKIK